MASAPAPAPAPAVPGSAPVPALVLKPYINFKVLTNPETAAAMAANIKHRNLPETISVAAVSDLYKTVIERTQQLDKARSERNRVAAEIKSLFGESKEAKRQKLVERGRVLKEEIHTQEAELAVLETQLYDQAVLIPNNTHPTTPIGPESAAQLIRIHGYPLLDHVTLSKQLDLVDFESAAAVTGSRWYYLKNEAALLELALVQFATQRAVKAGFMPVITPDVVRPEVVQACGFQPRDEASQTYWVSTTPPGSSKANASTLSQSDADQQRQQHHYHQHSALCLVATAEISLAGMNLDKTLEESQLPIKMAGFGRAFRAEAGSRGAEVKGLYRVHQFSKVELFVLSKADPGVSDNILEEIRKFQEDLFEELGLCYRVLDMPTEELGASAYKKYDIEAWMPGRNSWGEISSTSNCTDYQSRRLNIRYRTNKIINKPLLTSTDKPSSSNNDSPSSNSVITTEFAHTLNGTAMAIPRIIVALLETYQREDGSVRLPECLWPFMAGVKEIRPKGV
ncbi:hypothetical protein BCR41DRAFT_379308 [Lobosporangium transversale]|uniref:serine--tRNA ligase n=1 Tax=Lobosporangium transversale TaxID=64571 RepID=A0A1Y2G984_9FUNG|nr:hypothetical protein BCR41DRAFT_379308 [Lobosporangium transversale]ORY98374.1 hypothetical protein BCR41DRAFT_379308 [Lobosporangium transversale]|eukprot:XP_021875766.1 hypothetical protein BCR41DRAFT_379308 [Lobosporangium transversale]